MTLRAVGPFNGILPEPTNMIVGFMRDPRTMPYLRYAQLIPAPEIQFMYARVDPDEAVRLVDMNEHAWAYDDYRPTGKGWTVRVEWVNDTTQRWDFPYTLGEATIRVWSKSGIKPRMLYDKMRSNHAALHRAVRVVNSLKNASWGVNTATLNGLLGTTDASFDQSSGDQSNEDGTANDNFQVIKRAFQRVKRVINKATNGALSGEELIAVIPPVVAEAMSTSGEIFDLLKQSTYAKELADPNLVNWSLPVSYGGFKFVVEDTVRCFINQKADGTVADVSLSTEKDYIMTDDTVYFVARPGGLDSDYGGVNYSTVQVYHFGGEARVEAFSEPKHELVEGHVVMEDRVVTPALLSGFALTDVLSAEYQAAA